MQLFALNVKRRCSENYSENHHVTLFCELGFEKPYLTSQVGTQANGTAFPDWMWGMQRSKL